LDAVAGNWLNKRFKESNLFSAAGQIAPSDLVEAKAQGYKMFLNNRPDGEEYGQATSAALEQAAAELGIAYRHIPVVSGALTMAEVDATVEALEAADGPVLGFCRSGSRSTTVWALAQAKRGAAEPAALIAQAAQGGFDLVGLAPTLKALAGKA
jgi:uncharacterized protein (TIGR01244 family)